MKKATYELGSFPNVSLTGVGSIQVTGSSNGAELTISLYGDQFPLTDLRRDFSADFGHGVILTIFGDHEREAFIDMLCDYFHLLRK